MAGVDTEHRHKELPKSDWSCRDSEHSQACHKMLDEIHGHSLSAGGQEQALSKFGIPASTTNHDGSITTHSLTNQGGLTEKTIDPSDKYGFYSKEDHFFKAADKNFAVEKLGDDYFQTDARGVVTAYGDAQLSHMTARQNPDGTGYEVQSDAAGRERELHFGPAGNDNYTLYTGGKDSQFSQLNFTDIYKEAAPSSLEIRSAVNSHSAGTAVSLGRNGNTDDCLALTADHVVRSQGDNPDDKRIRPGLTATGTDGKQHPVEVLARDPQKDLALVSVKGDASCRPATLAGAQPEPGDSVVHLGYPSSDTTEKMTVVPGKISEPGGPTVCYAQGGAVEGTRVMQSDAGKSSLAAQPGMSGGPVVDKAGHLVGISDSSSVESNPLQATCVVSVTSTDVDELRQQAKLK